MGKLKKCHGCKIYLSFSHFHKSKKEKDGHYGYCKECKAKRDKYNYLKNKEKYNTHSKKYYIENKSKMKTAFRNNELRSKYGMTLFDYEKMLGTQKYKCGICRTLIPGGKGIFVVDHDHSTGKIRGLLCNQCNLAIGQFKNSIAILSNAIKYLNGGLNYE